LDGLSCCHYGGHFALVLLLTVRGLSNDDDDGAAKGSVLQELIPNYGRRLFRSSWFYVCAGTVSTGCAR
jgi:hypothetical protein